MSSSILFPTNQYAVGSKSHEEIMLLTTPKEFTLSEKLYHISTKGLPPQFPFLYRNFHEAYQQVLAFVCARAPSEHPDHQILIATSFKILLRKPKQVSEAQIELIFQMGLECLNNLQSSSNEDMGTVIELTIAKHPQPKQLIMKLEEKAMDLGRPPQPIISKVTSCRLISILALYMNRTLKGQMIDILKRVLSDNQPEVRKVWVSQIFPKLLKNLDLQFVELHLQEKIYEAVWDQNQEIASLALQTILSNAAKFSSQEQNSRIVKLFIDSLTSKREKIAVVASELMGPAYEKLLASILTSENLCLRFWRSIIEISNSKSSIMLNNLIYNLPGILSLSLPLYKVDAICDIYIELFYQNSSNKLILASYFHQMVKMFPSKRQELKQFLYQMMGELTEEETPNEEALKIVQKLMIHLNQAQQAFLESQTESQQLSYFEASFCQYFILFYNLICNTNHSLWQNELHHSIKMCSEHFPTDFIESQLLPKLYSSLRNKCSDNYLLTSTIVKLLMRDSNPSLINTYTSKISVELCKSSKSYERESAVLFLYHATFFCSIEMFQEYRLGEKYLSFNTDKNFKVKSTFVRNLPRMKYFFTREEKIQFSIIVRRLAKDSDIEIQNLMSIGDYSENQTEKDNISEISKAFRDKQIEKIGVLNVRKQNIIRRGSKELKKEDVLKKKIENTKSKTKMLIKDLPKKKVGPVLVKTSSNFHIKKHS